MSKLGSVLGPFPGSFWIDLETGELVLRQGTEGIVGEVRFSTTGDQRADLLERLLLEPIPDPRPGDPLFLVPIKPVVMTPRSIATTAVGRREISAGRPTFIRCACGRTRKVGPKGAVPKRCEECAMPRQMSTSLDRTIDDVIAKRGA